MNRKLESFEVQWEVSEEIWPVEAAVVGLRLLLQRVPAGHLTDARLGMPSTPGSFRKTRHKRPFAGPVAVG